MATNVPAGTTVGTIALNGNLSDWTAADIIDNRLSTAGYDVYGKVTGGNLVIALSAPVEIGAGTSVWLNTDQDPTTGFQIFGFTGGAEFNITMIDDGVPRLYTDGPAGAEAPGLVRYTTSADRHVVEMAVSLSDIESPTSKIYTMVAFNDEVFTPSAFMAAQYSINVAAPITTVGTVTLNGNLSDWTSADIIDRANSVAGYDIYAKATGGSLVFALVSPVEILPGTTAWLNTDQNNTTGFQIFGFAGGAEYNVNIDVAGVPRLYTGNSGQNLVSTANVSYGYNAARTVLEFAVPLSQIGNPAAVNTLWDVNDITFMPTAFQLAQYEVITAPRSTTVGTVTLDGSLAEWTAAQQIDNTMSVAGYDIYARATGGYLVFALHSPVPVGPNTTAWLNTDQNATTGFQIFGFAGGAEYNVNFDIANVPRLFTGNAGETLVPGATVLYGANADRTNVEFAVPLSAIGNPNAVNTLWDVNDVTFLPTAFQLAQYSVQINAPSPVVGAVTINGDLSDWTGAQVIDQTLSVAGYDIYGRATGGNLVIAMHAPTPIGPNTTIWLNTDNNAATGFQIFGFAGGAEYNINFDSGGVPHLYTGNSGQTLVNGVNIQYAYNADHTNIELALPLTTIGSPQIVSTLYDINDQVFLPTSFSATQYQIATTAPVTVGTVTLNGNLSDWTAADLIDNTLSVAGYDIYAKVTGGSYVFAIHAPTAIGINTTAWLNTDQNAATGFQIFGFAGGAEYNINFDATGTPRLYTGAAGQTLVGGAPVQFAYNGDHTTVEFSVSASAIGNPTKINTLFDINDNTFLPTSYFATQYAVVDAAAPKPTVGAVTLDGSLAEWTAAQTMDTHQAVPGYDIYSRIEAGHLVFALQAPTAVGWNTTAWLNTDQNIATGFRVFGSTVGAEYNINFDQSGTPHLYSGDAGQTLQPADVLYGYNADHSAVEFAVALAALGSPATVRTSWDVNNTVFIPTDFTIVQYQINTTTGGITPIPLTDLGL